MAGRARDDLCRGCGDASVGQPYVAGGAAVSAGSSRSMRCFRLMLGVRVTKHVFLCGRVSIQPCYCPPACCSTPGAILGRGVSAPIWKVALCSWVYDVLSTRGVSSGATMKHFCGEHCHIYKASIGVRSSFLAQVSEPMLRIYLSPDTSFMFRRTIASGMRVVA